MNDLYKNYQEKYGDSAASVETFRRKVFAEEIIGVSLSSANDCETCLEYKIHIQEVVHKNEEESQKCKICSEFPVHQSRFHEDRKEYHKNRDLVKKSAFPVYTADLMKVFVIPK